MVFYGLPALDFEYSAVILKEKLNDPRLLHKKMIIILRPCNTQQSVVMWK